MIITDFSFETLLVDLTI